MVDFGQNFAGWARLTKLLTRTVAGLLNEGGNGYAHASALNLTLQTGAHYLIDALRYRPAIFLGVVVFDSDVDRPR